MELSGDSHPQVSCSLAVEAGRVVPCVFSTGGNMFAVVSFSLTVYLVSHPHVLFVSLRSCALSEGLQLC